jgi:hypothetical protein
MPSVCHGLTIGPLWFSKGERFRPTGAYVFLQARYDEYRLLLKKIKNEHEDIMRVMRKRKQKTRIYEDDRLESTDEDTNNDEINLEIQDKGLLSLTDKQIKRLKEVKMNTIYAYFMVTKLYLSLFQLVYRRSNERNTRYYNYVQIENE